jgi:hypothetical protein
MGNEKQPTVSKTTVKVLRSKGVLENGMEHHAQTLLALSISSALCLAAWIWARRRLTRFSRRAQIDMTGCEVHRVCKLNPADYLSD